MHRSFGSARSLSGGVIFNAETSGMRVLAWPSFGLWGRTTRLDRFFFEEVLVFESFQFCWGYMAKNICERDLSGFTIDDPAKLGANDERYLAIVACLSWQNSLAPFASWTTLTVWLVGFDPGRRFPVRSILRFCGRKLYLMSFNSRLYSLERCFRMIV